MFKAPKHIHNLQLLLADLPTQDDARIAAHLGLSADTVRRYRLTNRAPRPVALALFWETRWGRSVLEVDQVNTDRMRQNALAAARAELGILRRQVQRLAPLARLGSANEAVYDLFQIVNELPTPVRSPAGT